MRRHRESSHSALVIITTLMTVFLVPLTSDGARSSRQRNNQASYRQQYGHRDNDVSQPDNDYYYDDEGSCDIEVACRTETDEAMPPTSMKLPIRGPKGPPGEPGRPGQDGIPGLPGLPGISSQGHQRVAFFVGLSDNVGPIKGQVQTPVIFDRVVTNIASAYDPVTGRFTAPINGTYQFNVVISAQGRHRAAVMIVKNGAMVATVWAESIPRWSTSTNVAVLSLDRDEQVWLLLLSRASFLHGYMYTTFSGFLIFEN